MDPSTYVHRSEQRTWSGMHEEPGEERSGVTRVASDHLGEKTIRADTRHQGVADPHIGPHSDHSGLHVVDRCWTTHRARIGYSGTHVACIAFTIPVRIGLIRVRYRGAIIVRVGNAIAITLARARLQRAGVLGIAQAVPIGIGHGCSFARTSGR